MNNMKLKTEDKTIKVISSCKTQEQLKSAEKYVLLYLKKYCDYSFYTHLLTLINLKKSELENV